MNKRMIYWIGGIAALIIILLVFWFVFRPDDKTEPDVTSKKEAEDDNLSSYLREQDTLMNKMMEDMESVEPTGNAALDFLTGMIPHHEAAVSMSESYLKYGGSDKELKKLAEDIITAQKEEIAQMQSYIEEINRQGTKDPEQEQAYLEAYENMMSSHHAGHMSQSTYGNVEAAFAEGMIMHHQMAVEMAQAILGNTDNGQVATLAQNIAGTQQTEISQMQDILKRVSEKTDSHH